MRTLGIAVLAFVTIITSAYLPQFKPVAKDEVALLEEALANISKHQAMKIVSRGISTGTAAGVLELGNTTIINFDEQGKPCEYYRLVVTKSNATGVMAKIANDAATRATQIYYSTKCNMVYTQQYNKSDAVNDELDAHFGNALFKTQPRNEFEKQYQRDVFEFLFHIINQGTIEKPIKKLSFNKKDRTHSFTLRMRPEPASAINKIEALTAGGLADIEHKSLDLTFVISEDKLIQTVIAEGTYTARIGGLGKIVGDQNTRVISTAHFTYHDEPVQVPWQPKS
ncbi:MAG: hypothetical protein FWE31_04860 [Firmicutes bacterium]|nr:hypothetical protein [Bacillota bacterium]